MKMQILVLIIVFLLSIFPTSALTISTVLSNPKEVSPGEASMIELGIENNGKNDITDVSVLLDFNSLPFAPELSSSEFNFEEIEEGKIRYANFRIRALNDAESGIYKIPVQITYTEKEESKKMSSIISMTINSKPILSASLEEGLLLKGSESLLVVKMVNKGLSNVKFLEAEMKKSAYYTITSPNLVYVGDLDSDDFDSVEFKVIFKDNAPNSVKIPLLLQYRDALNNEMEETIELNAQVYSKERATQLGLIKNSNIWIYAVIVIILIAAFVIYRRIRKNRKRRKEKEE